MLHSNGQKQDSQQSGKGGHSPCWDHGCTVCASPGETHHSHDRESPGTGRGTPVTLSSGKAFLRLLVAADTAKVPRSEDGVLLLNICISGDSFFLFPAASGIAGGRS